MATLCFGGSFNPIHHGHLICARAAAERGGYDSVLFIPAAQPPHKPDVSHLADPLHRLAMCRVAVEGLGGLELSDIELTRGEPSYTISTARELKNQGWNEVHWLIGADMLNYLPKWHEPEALLREVNFVIMARAGWNFEWENLPLSYQALKERVVEVPQIEISATDIRQRVAGGLPIDFLTPARVVDYIREQRLYGGQQG